MRNQSTFNEKSLEKSRLLFDSLTADLSVVSEKLFNVSETLKEISTLPFGVKQYDEAIYWTDKFVREDRNILHYSLTNLISLIRILEDEKSNSEYKKFLELSKKFKK